MPSIPANTIKQWLHDNQQHIAPQAQLELQLILAAHEKP